MQIGDRFIGRDRELAQLELAIGPGDDGLRLAMLTGPSGLGKTTLTHVALGRAQERGYRVALANGRAGTLSTPFVPWMEALPELREVLEAAQSVTVDMEQLGIELVNVLTEISAEQPLLLVFDDAQALDESSLALLPYAVGVSERMNLTVLIVEQDDAVGIPDSYRSFVDGLLARRVVQHLLLGPMGDDAIRELAAGVIGVEDPVEVPAEIVIRAQGNPWFTKELAEAWKRGDSEIPVSIAAAATARLHSLAENAQDVVSAVAVCPEGAYIGWLDAVADEKPRQFVRTMEAIKASGLIREDGDIVSIAHPLMQQSLLDELSAAMRRALHMELAEIIEQVPLAEVTQSRALGYHLSEAGKPDLAVAHFLRAAEANDIQGQLHEAVADYVRALDAEPRIESRVDLLRRCGFACMQVNNERASEFWNELGRITAARGDNEIYAYALFQQYWTSSDGSAVDRLERAAALGTETYGWSARAQATLCTLSGDYEAAIVHDELALKLAREAADPLLETLSLEKLSLSYSYVGGRLEQAIEASRSAVAIAIQNRLHGWAFSGWHTLSEVLAENLETDRSLQESLAACKYVEDLNLVRYSGSVRTSVARGYMRTGRLEEARTLVEEAWQGELRAASPVEFKTFVAWTRAVITVECGDVAHAESAVETAITAAEQLGYQSWIFEARLAQARLMALRGNIDDAVQLARTLDINEPVSMAGVACWLSRIGTMNGHDGALELARSITFEDDPLFPLESLMRLETDALLGVSEGSGLDALRHVVVRWNESGRALDALRVEACIGVLLARSGNQADAITLLTAVRRSLAERGAAHDADVVAAQLRGLGTRSRAKSRSTAVGNLTRRELEIARLVASGLRNAEVAAQLFLAEKTVAAHLSNIYGKLEVRSRVQLTAWLQEHDDDTAAAAS